MHLISLYPTDPIGFLAEYLKELLSLCDRDSVIQIRKVHSHSSVVLEGISEVQAAESEMKDINFILLRATGKKTTK